MDNQTPPGQPKPGTMTFGSKPPAHTGPDPELYSQLANVTRRVRIIEESVSSVRKKTNIDEENNLAEIKKLHTSLKSLFSEIDEIKKEQSSFKDEMRRMISEFQTVAKKDEVEVLKKYIKIWEPVQFATVNQVEKMIDQATSNMSFSQPSFTQPSSPIIEDEKPDMVEKESDENEDVDSNDDIFGKHTYEPTSEYVKLDTTAEDEASSNTVSADRKKQIAAIIEEYDDVREMILHKPHEFIEQLKDEPELSKLFSGVNILELSKKLKPHYEQ